MTQKLVIKKSDLEKIATNSILGMCLKSGFIPGELTLVFKGSSLDYCQEHGGPEWVIIPDYVPFCILECALHMTKNGWDVKVELDNSK